MRGLIRLELINTTKSAQKVVKEAMQQIQFDKNV